MKFTCTRASIIKSLQLFSHVLDKPSAERHALHYAVGMATHQDHLTLHATTHDQHTSLSIPATIVKTGRTILPFDVILDFLKALSKKTLTLSMTTKKDNIHLEGESTRLVLPTVDTDWTLLAPPLPKGISPQLTLPIKMLSAMFQPVLSSVAKENGRYCLQAIQVHILPTPTPTLITIGTDGQRLTRMTHQTGAWVKKPHQCVTALIPKRTARLLVEIAHQTTEGTTVSLTLTNPTWIFQLPNCEVRTQNFSGSFPDYTKIIPSALPPTIKVSRSTLMGALRRMETISDPLSHPITIQVNQSEMLLSTVNTHIGEAHEPVDATIHMNETTLGFNGKMLLEGLGTTEAEQIEWSVDSPTAPCVMISPEDPSWTHVLMPVRMS